MRNHQNSSRRYTFVRVALFLATVAVAVGGAVIITTANAEKRSSDVTTGAVPIALTVTAAGVQSRNWPRVVDAAGPVAAWEEASVGTLVSGLRVTEVRANVGDVVKKGTVLVRFDLARPEAEVAELMAELALAQAQAARSQVDLVRADTLRGGGALSEQDALQYKTLAETSRAQVAASSARLDVKKLQLKHSTIVAPDDGMISARTVTIGVVAPAGQELFRLIRRQRLEWRGEVTAAQIALVRQGQIVRLTLPDGSASVARIRQLAPSMNAQTRLGTVYADIDASSQARAGMFASARIELAPSTARVVPSMSVLIRDGRSVVALLGDGAVTSKVTMRVVTIGRRMGNEVEITDGLNEHDRVVTQGASFLGDGDLVRLVEPSGKPTTKG